MRDGKPADLTGWTLVGHQEIGEGHYWCIRFCDSGLVILEDDAAFGFEVHSNVEELERLLPDEVAFFHPCVTDDLERSWEEEGVYALRGCGDEPKKRRA